MFPAENSGTTLSFATAVVLVAKASVATDPFLLTKGYECGVAMTFIICLVMFIVTQFSFYLLMKTWIFGSAYSYGSIWQYNWGTKFKWFPIVLELLCWGIFVVWHSKELYENLLDFITCYWSSHPEILENKWLLVYGTLFLTTFPCLFFKRVTSFTALSWISIFAVVIGSLCLGVRVLKNLDAIKIGPSNKVVLFNMDMKSICDCTAKFQMAFFCHPVLCYILRELEQPTMNRCVGVTWWANVISMLLHYVSGLLGYLLFEDHGNAENVFYFIGDSYAPEVVIGRIACYIVSIISNAFYTYLLAETISKVIISEQRGEQVSKGLPGLVVITFAIMVNTLDEKLFAVLEILANFAYVMLSAVLPPAFYIGQFSFGNKKWSTGSVILIIFGVITCLMTLYSSISKF